MNKVTFGALRLLAATSLCLVFGLARAQDDPTDADPPDRAGRLSFVQGDVSLRPAGEDEWATAIVNRPLTTGDQLWTDQGARAEIYVGQAAVRLGSNTGFSFLNVDDDTIQMRMTAGVINVRVRALTDEQIEIDTPNLALSLLRPGNYRVEVNDAGDTTVVKVSEGEAEGSDGSQHVIVHAQQSATFKGTEQFVARFGSLGETDEFDSWTRDRERRDDRVASSQTAQYVAPDVTGYEDLEYNGTWSSEPEYGAVWTPTRVATDWSPYRYGRWAWVRPWGWTWIDDAPWGFTPFHYGRWAHLRNRWCWVPGPRHGRAVYAPALVGWVGSPGVAWFPLGPREVYVPARRFSPRYVERVNVSNSVLINRTVVTEVYNNRARNVTYRNRVVPGAVTAVSRTTFASAQRVDGRRIRVDEQQITRADATMAPQLQPVRESRLSVSEAARRIVRTPPATVVNRQVIVKREPPPAAANFPRNQRQIDAARERIRAQDQADRNEAARRNRPGDSADAKEDRQQQRHLQERRQAEQVQQQVRELVTRQREQQPAAAQEPPQRQSSGERQPVERPQTERQNRPEPQKPRENKPQPQEQQDHKSRQLQQRAQQN